MNTLCKTFIFFPVSLIFSITIYGTDLIPERLRCEYLVNPQIVDVDEPRLSWELRAEPAGACGLQQTAYQVKVASSRALLIHGEPDLWDSKKVSSCETVGIVYAGKKLYSRLRCYWKVRVWDQDGEVSPWSEPAVWTMGLLNPSDWKARWISDPSATLGTPANYGFRSSRAESGDETRWVQIDLGEIKEIEAVRLWGAWPVGQLAAPGSGFPLRFRIEAAREADFSDARMIVDRTGGDVPNPGIEPLLLEFPKMEARFVRLTAVRLSGDWNPEWDSLRTTWKAKPADINLRLALAEMEVIGRRGSNVALGKIVTSSDSSENDSQYPAVPWFEKRLNVGWSEVHLTDGLTHADPGSRFHIRPVTLLRKTFVLRGKVKSATLYATALGSYEFYLNGKRVGNQVLAPGWTVYPKRVLYQSYDVTGLLGEGPNAIAAMLADGWYRMREDIDWFGTNRRFTGFLVDDDRWLLGQLEIEYEDGRHETVITDRTWLSHSDGPIRYSSIFDGVLYDTRKEIPGWDQPGLSSRDNWQACIEKPVSCTPLLSAQMMEPIHIIRELRPCSISRPGPGLCVYDFGEQITGVCRIKIKGAPGTEVRLRHSEMLKPDGNIYVANLIGAYNNMDRIILGDRGVYSFTPPFVYHGFRYVEVTGLTPLDSLCEITALEITSDVPRASDFVCSDHRLNRLCMLVDRAYRSCMKSLTVDVAARDERMPWLGDCYTDEIQSLSYMYDYAAFGANHLRAISNTLNSDGIAFVFTGTENPEGRDGVAGWSDASVAAPYTLWANYADLRSLELGYEGARTFMNTLDRANPGGVPGRRYYSLYGDWLSARMTIPPEAVNWEPKGGRGAPDSLFAAAFWAHSADLTAKMAAALDKPGDSLRFTGLTARIRSALIKNHVWSDGVVSGDEPSCYALVLGMNHLEEGDLRRKSEARLLESIRDYNSHLATGSISTIYLLKYLAENGYQDLAYRMVMQPTCPSYGFMVDQGATAMWERFDGWHPELGFNPSPMNAFNHLGMNSVFEWIFGYIAGIRPDPEYPGYKHFFIGPEPGGGPAWMKASYHSVRGRIECAYQIREDQLEMQVTVPPNTSATVILPATTLEGITESGKNLTEAEYISIQDATTMSILLKSGSYSFSIPQKDE